MVEVCIKEIKHRKNEFCDALLRHCVWVNSKLRLYVEILVS
jgi:hypothetical protein